MTSDPLKALKGASALLAKANRILNEDRYIRLEPCRVFYTYYSLNKPRAIVHNYYQELPEIEVENATIIIHGHEFGSPCFGPHFCHEYGWLPDDSINPFTRRLFYLAHPIYRVQRGREESVLEGVDVSESSRPVGEKSVWDGELVLDSFF